MDRTERRVTTSDCALALAVPLTRAEFLGDLDPRSPHDFAKRIALRRPKIRPDVLWEDHYGPVAALLGRVEEDVKAHGVAVHRGVTLGGLRDLLARYPVVTVVAHWRFPCFGPADILDPAGLLRGLQASSSLIARSMRDRIERLNTGLMTRQAKDQPAADDLAVALAAELDAAVEPTRTFYEQRGRGRSDADPFAPPVRVTRAALEEEFPTAIRPGPAVELRDGLHAVADVVDAFPEGFDGVVDLSVCNSVILGEAIKRRHHGCLVILNERPATIEFRMIRYKHVVRELSRAAPDRYTDVLVRLNRALLDRLT